MSAAQKKAFIEVLKSFARFIWFGLLGLVGTFAAYLVSSGQIANITVVIAGQTIDLTFIVLGLLTGLVKLLDRYVKTNKTIKANGIAPGILQR